MPSTNITRLSTVSLASGRPMPCIGYGTGTRWFKSGEDANSDTRPLDASVVEAVKHALQAGFIHLDSAEMYGTERETGEAIRQFCSESGVSREQLWVTTKIFQGIGDVAKAARASLARLGLDYLDLYLVHAPFWDRVPNKPEGLTMQQVWQGLEKLVDEGLVREIGVSNFRVTDLQDLLSYARIKPAVNQVEAHPYLQQPQLRQLCKEQGILLQAYSPLLPLTDKQPGPVVEVVERIAAVHNATPAQVLLRWSLQSSYVPITTTSKADRLKEFMAAGAGELAISEAEVAEIDKVGNAHKQRRYWTKEFLACDL